MFTIAETTHHSGYASSCTSYIPYVTSCGSGVKDRRQDRP